MSVFYGIVTRKEGEGVPQGLKAALADQWGRAQGQTPVLAFLAGLGTDILTLGRIDEPRNIVLQLIYLGLAALTLIASIAEKSSWVHTGSTLKRFLARGIVRYGRLVFHFATGALLSAFTFFYFKSSSGVASFVFFALLAAGLVLNELPSFKRMGAVFRAVLFQLSLVSFLTYILPMLAGELHLGLFALGIVVSTVLVFGIGLGLQGLGVEESRINRSLRRPALGVTAAFVLFYALQWIPPIPLSVQSMRPGHDVQRVGASYHVMVDKDADGWGEATITKVDGERLYIFARIFAPRNFKERVYLRWERFDESEGWVQTDRIVLPIRGGRALGFRGYTYKENYQSGRWRVFIETADGREIGRTSFLIKKVDGRGKLRAREKVVE